MTTITIQLPSFREWMRDSTRMPACTIFTPLSYHPIPCPIIHNPVQADPSSLVVAVLSGLAMNGNPTFIEPSTAQPLRFHVAARPPPISFHSHMHGTHLCCGFL